MTHVARLMEWYAVHCDGDWEEEYGVEIGTLDNPGWRVSIDLIGTELEDESMNPVTVENTEESWWHCKVADDKFMGAGGARNLTDIIDVFFRFCADVEAASKR